MKHAFNILLSVVMLLSSCTKGYLDHGDSSSGESMPELIGWSVSADLPDGALDPKTRALVDDYDNLRDACTLLESHEPEKIGLLGEYTLDGVSKVVFDNIDLWWWEKEDGNPYFEQDGGNSYWNYSGDNVYWTDDADYTFKAYFPKSKVELQPGSGAEKLLAVYDTEISQYDLLVAHRQLKSKEENPVKLDMLHALSALKFDFQFVDDDVTDHLLACWLENHRSDGFYTSSTLNYSNEVVWPKSTATPVGTPIYYWEPFAPLAITGTHAVEAYSTSASVGKGGVYTDNSGWILIIPQASDKAGSLKLCFKTDTGGNVVYRVDLPAYEFAAGSRYNYHVKMTSTEIKVGLTISDWNERKSSYEIDFNE